jgi:mono/diheme cytochrome c family protein
MKRAYLVILTLAIIFAVACKSGNKGSDATSKPVITAAEADPNRGIGPWKDVEVSPTLDHAMAEKGQKISESKCLSCHKLTDERLVGPGWKGVTERQTPEWILNFTTNTEEMLDKDPIAQAQLEICLVRMPNQGVSDEEALQIYEFMRKNDGVQ